MSYKDQKINYMEDINLVKDQTFNYILNEKIGFGRAQFLACLACSFIWMGDGAEMYVQSFLSPLLQKEFKIPESEAALLPSFVFWGNFVGSLCSGPLSDPYSRKQPLILSILGLCLSAVLSTFAPAYWLLILLRTVFGFFFGLVTTISITYVSEILPKQVRGSYYLYFGQSWPLGELFTVFIAYCTMDNLESGNIKYLLFFAAIPSFISLIVSIFYLFESPRHALTLGKKDRYQSLFKLIDYIGFQNDKNYKAINDTEKKSIADYGDSIQTQSEKVNFKELFLSHNRLQTIKVIIIWQSLAFVYYGVNFSLPTMIMKMSNEDSKDSNKDNFRTIIISILAEFPSYWVSGYFVENKKLGGRRSILFISYALSAFSSLVCLFQTSPNFIFVTLVSVLKFFMSMAFMVVNTFTAELYNTNIRATSLGFFNAVCKLAGVFMPIVVNLFYFAGPTGPFLIFAILSFFSALTIYTMKDTTNNNLDQYQTIE